MNPHGNKKKINEDDSKEKLNGLNIIKEKPRVYRVKQHPKYIMHEYSDKYELFKETKDGLVYIRTDMK